MPHAFLLHFYVTIFQENQNFDQKNFWKQIIQNLKKIMAPKYKKLKIKIFYAEITTFWGYFGNIFGNSGKTRDFSLSPLSRLYCRDNIVVTPIVIVATMSQQSQV